MFNLKKRDLKVIIMLLITGGIIYFLISIKLVLLTFFLGIILAYLLFPIVKFLRDKNFSRLMAIYILIIIFLFCVCFIAFFIFPIFLNELESLSKMIPDYIKQVESYFNYFNHEYHRIHLPALIKEAVDQTLNRAEEIIISSIKKFTETLLASLSFIFSLVVAPIISYYLLKDFEKIKRSILLYIPRKQRRLALKLGQDINKIFVGYLRGLIWVSIIVGFLTSVGLYFFKIKFYLILGILAAITNMIPYIGPIIGGIPAVFIALMASPLKGLGVFILYILIQQLESSIIGPKIMSEKVGLHPLTIIFSLLAGAELFGSWGLILAIPLAGSIKVIIKFVWQQLKSRNLF